MNSTRIKILIPAQGNPLPFLNAFLLISLSPIETNISKHNMQSNSSVFSLTRFLNTTCSYHQPFLRIKLPVSLEVKIVLNFLQRKGDTHRQAHGENERRGRQDKGEILPNNLASLQNKLQDKKVFWRRDIRCLH